ncbi:hypothetical protein FJ417_27720 [Mesorhizobium sp. B3-1-7]|nr:hypothetical protein FJ417_27720 [Mesorhizobium sp. B3-1-7]
MQTGLQQALSSLQFRAAAEAPRHCLFAIMYHQFLDQLRRAKRHEEAVQARWVTTSGISPLQQSDRDAPSEMLSALQQLAPEQRAALVLVAVEGFSYADVVRRPATSRPPSLC